MDFSTIERFIMGHKVRVLLLFLSLIMPHDARQSTNGTVTFDIEWDKPDFRLENIFPEYDNTWIYEVKEAVTEMCESKHVHRDDACSVICRLTKYCQGYCHDERCQCFQQKHCPIKCRVNSRQFGCPDYCKCQNLYQNICSYDTGDCYCEHGWRGPNCSERCSEGSYGFRCLEICKCMNNATCDHISGRCNCTAGYEGPYCDQKCPLGSHGYECSDICKCQNDAICHHVDGSCDCGPGWFGEVCAKRCPDGYFGINCLGRCYCKNNSTCNFVSGECNCADGFYGNTCVVQCFSNEWGKNHSQTCDSFNGDCATNNEMCLPGFHGVNCSKLDCDKDKWGQNCSNECNCKHGGLCHPVTGTCCCRISWTGEDCSVRSKGYFSNQSNEKTGVHSSVVDSAICIPVIILLLVVTGALFYRKLSVVIRNCRTDSSNLRFSRLREE